MWIPVVLSLLSLAQPISSFETSYNPRVPLLRPTSLEDCIRQAANQLSRWKEVYGVCYAMFLKNDAGQGNSRDSIQISQAKFQPGQDSSPGSWQANQAQAPSNNDYVMSTDARYRGLTDVNAAVTSVYAQKRKSEESLSDRPLQSDENEDNDDDRGDDEEVVKRLWVPSAHLPPVLRRAMYRSRRQHALSINHALVSLADMLVSKNMERDRARQRAFHQQLLSLGR